MAWSLTGITAWLDRHFYARYVSEEDLFRERIESLLTRSSIVLDAGCGRGLFNHDYKHRSAFLVGCDLTPRIGENEDVHVVAMANLNALPFPDASFDLVFSRYVVEHLTEPQEVFREIARVLKAGGYLIVLTPNAYHYVSLVGRFTPHVFHEVVARIRGNRCEDTFPTAYKANTRRQLTNCFSLAQLEIVEYCTHEAKPNYLTVSPVTYAAGILYERLVNRFDALQSLRISIVAVAQSMKRRDTTVTA
jgi:SAM-dependent methyltransferase